MDIFPRTHEMVVDMFPATDEVDLWHKTYLQSIRPILTYDNVLENG